jgi:hypothetical protein
MRAKYLFVAVFSVGLAIFSTMASAQSDTTIDERADKGAQAIMEQTKKDWRAQNPLNEPYDAYIHKDYATAFSLFRPLAAQGNAKAQTAIGLMYLRGEGVEQNDTEAEKWFRKGAEQGQGKADLMLGFMYFQGRGVTQDYTESMKWYRKAADNGEDVPRSLIGDTYPCPHCSSPKYNAAAQQQDEQQLKDQRLQENMDEMNGDLVNQQLEQQQEIEVLERREQMR